MIEAIRRKNLHTWLGGYTRHLVRAASRRARPRDAIPRRRGPRHVLFAFCDHWEPLWGGAPRAAADARVRAWAVHYPELVRDFRDADGRPPRHSFFFPGEQYERRWLDALADLARRGLGEVEFHLHHDGDTADNLRRDIGQFLAAYAEHGHLARDADGRLRYGFIHGNWCLANARRDRRWCGVDAEIPLLFETGCYADYTFPAAPDESQPNIVNQIYWPSGDLARKRAYEEGVPARVGEVKRDRILMIEGPLALARRPGSMRVRIESAAISAADPATPSRVESWVDQEIHVEGRPDWIFVKVHTHGAPDAQAASLLGDGGRALHHALTSRYNDGDRYALHYVTAREMFNIAIACMEGNDGNPFEYRDYALKPPPVAA